MIDALNQLGELLLDGDAPHANGKLDVFDPTTGDLIAGVATSMVDDCLAAVETAEQAAGGWAAAPPRERAEILRRCYETMMAEQAQIAALLQLENGKPMAEALGEVAYAADFFRWFSEEAVRIAGEVRRAWGRACSAGSRLTTTVRRSSTCSTTSVSSGPGTTVIQSPVTGATSPWARWESEETRIWPSSVTTSHSPRSTCTTRPSTPAWPWAMSRHAWSTPRASNGVIGC